MGRLLFTPDPQIFWVPMASIVALRAIHNKEPVAILATGPPYSTFLLAWFLKRMLQLPLVLDYRDLWNDNPWFPIPSGVRRHLEPWLERRIVGDADLIIANHEPMRRALLKAIPEIRERCAVIPNGFDRDELGPKMVPTLRKGEPFKIVYAGALYKGKVYPQASDRALSLETPYPLLRALRRFAEGPLKHDHPLEAWFIGARREAGQIRALSEAAARCDLAASVKVLETVPKPLLVPHLRSAHAFLLFVHDTGVQIMQKVYEYMHLGIPIMGLIRNSPPNAELIRRSGCGQVMDPEDEDSIYEALVAILHGYRSGAPPLTPDRSFIDQFDLEILTEDLARHLDRLLTGRSIRGSA